METALLKVVNDLRLNTDKGKASVLILLDLSAAFDMVDHCILINRLEKLIGLSGNVLNWFKTYITARTFSVNIGDCQHLHILFFFNYVLLSKRMAFLGLLPFPLILCGTGLHHLLVGHLFP